ncbi:MAG: hypothetical protein QOF22_891 [Bradyrhizobium sp.]|jgi:hypothetical protein|nr:hypothetical protein [Bradyrhizobium sp.]
MIELLESRIAPATFVSATTATYTDVDGDSVTVKFSAAILTSGNVNTILTETGNGLQTIDLTSVAGAASGSNITLTAVRSAVNGGDGFANVGYINGTNIDLGVISIDGDLAKIDAGNSGAAGPAVKKISAQSMGNFDTATGAADLISDFEGSLDALAIKGDFSSVFFGATTGTFSVGPITIGGAYKNSTILAPQGIGDLKIGGNMEGGTLGSSAGNIGNMTIGGSVLAAGSGNTAFVNVQGTGNIGNITIGGDVNGGIGVANSANFNTGGNMGNITVGGSIFGGLAQSGSFLSSGNIGIVKIAGDLKGGSANNSGAITAGGTIAGLTVGGSVIGGTPAFAGSSTISGAVTSGGNMGSVTIGKSLVGGNDVTTGMIRSLGTMGAVKIGDSILAGSTTQTGFISSVGDMGAVTIGHDLVGTVSTDAGTVKSGGKIGGLTMKGSISSGKVLANLTIGAISVKGSIVGTTTAHAQIFAGGNLSPANAAAALAMKSISVTGRVEFADVRAGYDNTGAAVNEDVQIGAVKVKGAWVASDLVAGVKANAGGFGDGDDAAIANGGANATISKIASIVIGGEALGTPSSINNTDHFGFVSQQIGSFKVGGTVIPLIAGASNDNAANAKEIGITADLTVREVL